jgi:hypothetical protein
MSCQLPTKSNALVTNETVSAHAGNRIDTDALHLVFIARTTIPSACVGQKTRRRTMSAFGEMMKRYRSYREKSREHRNIAATYMAISELPQHIRKDIGWPAAYERQREYH